MSKENDNIDRYAWSICLFKYVCAWSTCRGSCIFFILLVHILLRANEEPRNKQEANFIQWLALRLRPSTFWKQCIQRQLHTNVGNEQRPQSQEFEQRLAAILSLGRQKTNWVINGYVAM